MSAGELELCTESAESGTPFRSALEQFLARLQPRAAAEWMQLLREGRAAWLPLLRVEPGARALLVGNACSGTAVALARAGLHLTLVDSSAARLRFARARDRVLAAGDTHFVQAAAGLLPFEDKEFALVVRESQAPPLGEPSGFSAAELARVCNDELLTVEENRFAYKRSSGRRADFAVARPLEFAAASLAPAHGARSLSGHRRARAALGFETTGAHALYPHAHDFTYVVGLDGGGPELLIGPKERANRAKLIGHRLGLFPWLAPSFAVVGRRGSSGLRRIEHQLAEIAERLDTPAPRLEHLIASRGNCAVMLTAAADGSPDPAGRWCLHIALGPHAERQSRRHAAFTRWTGKTFPDLPVPEPLLEGEFGGQWIGVERRLNGMGSPQQQKDGPERARTHLEVAAALAACITERARPTRPEDLELLVEHKLARVAARARDKALVSDLRRLTDAASELLLGESLPRVLYHSDLRAKHVQVDAAGALLGFMDWGSAVRADLPYFDLLNLVLHDRKQGRGGEIGDAWRDLHSDAGLTRKELRPLDAYAEAIGLGPRARVAIELLFPVLVGAMAEGNWDYSRPAWMARSFGLDGKRPLPNSERRLAQLDST